MVPPIYPATDDARISQALSNWRQWSRQQPKLIRRLPGESHLNLLVSDGGRLRVVKCWRASSPHGADFAVCAAIQAEMAGHDLTPALLYQGDKILVSDYCAGDTFDIRQHQHLLPVLGDIIAQVHAMAPVCVVPELDLASHLENFVTLLQNHPDTTAGLADLAWQALHRVDRFLPDQTEPAFCHNDLNPANIIVSGNTLQLLDWEYAALGNPLFDLAVFCHEAALSEQQQAALLHSCLPALSPSQLQAMLLVYDLLQILWRHLYAAARQDTLNLMRVLLQDL
ncbi:MAG: phosphotransferase [Pseudomonadales bacterium]|nr:phosphotransferase [Pseudomonadales bacterium]